MPYADPEKQKEYTNTYSKQWQKRYRAENGEKVRAGRRAYYAKNRQRIQKVERERRLKDPEKYKTLSREHARQWRLDHLVENREYHRKYYLKRVLQKYGMTEDDYQRQLQLQGGVCDICKQPPRGERLAVDHDHSTGNFRGLLHANCNAALGLLQDDLFVVEGALKYLLKHRQEN